MTTPKTLIHAVRYFSDLSVCNRYMRQIKWPNGVACPKCGSANVGEIASRNMLQCKSCRKQFSYKVGTIFEDSPLGLDKWFVAVWCIANAKNGISSHELGRALGVTQKTAWFMLHRIREAMRTGTFNKLRGTVESDETFVGGESKNMHKAKRAKLSGTGGADKTAVMGLLQRHGPDKCSTVRAEVLPNRKKKTIHEVIAKHVEPGSAVFSDALLSYAGLNPTYIHDFIDHAEAYVKDKVHTNGLENFWSLFKRCIKGTHVSIEPFHLAAYVDSEAFRFNHRKVEDGDRFAIALPGAIGKRLTYKALIGKDSAEPDAASGSIAASVRIDA